MNTLEHLEKIKSRCQELLVLAEKRTSGAWPAFGGNQMRIYQIPPQEDDLITNDDCRFISSCAGAAEAGWLATIAAIETLPALRVDDITWRVVGIPLLNSILAAWPEELLS